MVIQLLAGLLLAVALPLRTARRAVALSVLVAAGIAGTGRNSGVVSTRRRASEFVWQESDLLPPELRRMNPKKYLYELHAQRVASLRTLPLDRGWDETGRFEIK